MKKYETKKRVIIRIIELFSYTFIVVLNIFKDFLGLSYIEKPQ